MTLNAVNWVHITEFSFSVFFCLFFYIVAFSLPADPLPVAWKTPVSLYKCSVQTVVSRVGLSCSVQGSPPNSEMESTSMEGRGERAEFCTKTLTVYFFMQNGALWIWMCLALYISLFETERDFKKKRLKWSVWNTWLIFNIHHRFTFVALFVILIHPEMNQDFHFDKQAFE